MKTIKIFKIICLIALFAIIAHVAVANSSSFADAKKNLNETLYKVIKNDFKKLGNYLYENNIDRLEEVVTVVVAVDDFQQVKLLQAKCDNWQGTEYVKDLFLKNTIKADPLLCGKKFIIDLRLLYITK